MDIHVMVVLIWSSSVLVRVNRDFWYNRRMFIYWLCESVLFFLYCETSNCVSQEQSWPCIRLISCAASLSDWKAELSDLRGESATNQFSHDSVKSNIPLCSVLLWNAVSDKRKEKEKQRQWLVRKVFSQLEDKVVHW